MTPIHTKQLGIIEKFEILAGDFEMTINYLIELGEKLQPYPEQYRNDDHIVKGCQSKVWLYAEHKNGKVTFLADSNTAITKGLLSLLLEIFTNQSPNDILNGEVFFPQKIGMDRFVGTQRTNGFLAMIKQIKIYALAFQNQ